jgi:SAM-dependent methyltransferase
VPDPDPIFAHPHLAAIYDALDPDRRDLDPYVALASELGARSALDVGCGTGTLALLLAARGLEVTAVDPAAASLAVARAKPGAPAVRWLVGDARTLPPLRVDLATMTGNTAQAITDPRDWAATLDGIHAALRPGGHLVFETRDPAFRGWEEWTRATTHRVAEVPGEGEIETWVDLLDVALPLVTFRHTWRFRADGTTLTSDSTLRFRPRSEVESDLAAAGYELAATRDAPDRPGRELVFVARRAENLGSRPRREVSPA